MLVTPPKNSPLSQGDILDQCPLVGLDISEPPSDLRSVPVKRWLARVIILTQSCDLVQGKVDRVLVAPLHDAQRLVDAGVLKGSVIRDQMRRHLVFGWYFLPEATAPTTLAESVVDLRDVHCVPRLVLEHLIAHDNRIATLTSPFREHLAQHFAVTYMRVALPEPYATRTQP